MVEERKLANEAKAAFYAGEEMQWLDRCQFVDNLVQRRSPGGRQRVMQQLCSDYKRCHETHIKKSLLEAATSGRQGCSDISIRNSIHSITQLAEDRKYR